MAVIWQQPVFIKASRVGSKKVDQIKANLLTIANAMLNCKFVA